MRIIKAYYYLTKPGIIYGNAIAAIAGFLLAAKWQSNFGLFLAMLAGISFVIASACVFNNYIDRGIDEKMERTKKRALVKKSIPATNALIFGTILGIIGFGSLFFFTNLLTTLTAFIGFFFYVVMYSIWKRKSSFGTIVGSVSGAIPPVVGYVAVTNNFDVAAFLLFLLLVLWQMPHFYAIAIFRRDDYDKAGIPVLSVEKNIQTTKVHILFYILLFILTIPFLTIFGYTGYIYLVVMLVLSLIWFWKGMRGFKINNNNLWARGMFKFSLIILLAMCVMISLHSI